MVEFNISLEAARALEDYYFAAKIPTRPIRRSPASKATDPIQTMITDDANHKLLLRSALPGETIEDTIMRWAAEPLTVRARHRR